jgi:hypothetical protein
MNGASWFRTEGADHGEKHQARHGENRAACLFQDALIPRRKIRRTATASPQPMLFTVFDEQVTIGIAYGYRRKEVFPL